MIRLTFYSLHFEDADFRLDLFRSHPVLISAKSRCRPLDNSVGVKPRLIMNYSRERLETCAALAALDESVLFSTQS